MARTIPEPTNDDFKVAFNGLLLQGQSRGLDLVTDEHLRGFVQHAAEVIAQLEAEVRWLRNIVNERGGD